MEKQKYLFLEQNLNLDMEASRMGTNWNGSITYVVIVRFQVLQEDNLSPKICHACISYLNSWQSFKNRCDAAEKKQKSWLEIDGTSNGVDRNAVIQHVRELCPGVTIESISQKVQTHPTNRPLGKSPTNYIPKENGSPISSTSTKQMDLVNLSLSNIISC